MLPLPGQAVPLALINATIDKKVDQYVAQQNATKTVLENTEVPAVPTISVTTDDPVAVAKGLILQAELLEQDALAKREEAYTLAPDLKPGRGRPALPEDIKNEKLEERKIKRRERDQKKAAESKIAAKTAALDSKVAAKIERDRARLEESVK